jgi:hypothetical protein
VAREVLGSCVVTSDNVYVSVVDAIRTEQGPHNPVSCASLRWRKVSGEVGAWSFSS